MKNTLLTVFCYLFSFLVVNAQKRTVKYINNSKATVTRKIEIPATSTTETITYHTGFALLYNEKHEQANWVAYQLKKEETISTISRSTDFQVDPYIITGSADDLDYEGQGYDKGHLAPAADMGWSAAAMSESFYYSNVSPQLPAFNRGVWKRLEELIRFWATEYDSIYVVTGPVLQDGLTGIGPHHVSVPEYYYKTILRFGAHPAAIGFVLPNRASAATLKTFAVSIDSVETLTGIDFFASLPNELEKVLERVTTTDEWKWRRSVTNFTVSEPEKVPATKTVKRRTRSKSKPVAVYSANTAIQCSGITKAGSRCKRTTTNSSGRCWQH